MITTETHTREHHLTLTLVQVVEILAQHAATKAGVKLDSPGVEYSVRRDKSGSAVVVIVEDLMPQAVAMENV